jgi:hypothetical protein
MARGKGLDGASCSEAIKGCFRANDVFSATELFKRVKAVGDWKDETVWQHLMSTVVNLIPARHHWKATRPFLFLRPDGRYELFDERQHPKPID